MCAFVQIFVDVDPVPLPVPDRNAKLPLIEVKQAYVVFSLNPMCMHIYTYISHPY